MSIKKGGKIAPIKHEPNGEQNTKNSLLRVGRTRTPGTGVYRFPYKELSGKYRTGLDEDAGYIERILNKDEKQLEKKRVIALREKLERALSVDLGPYSKFWNYALRTEIDPHHVSQIKLVDDVNFFNFADPMQELAFAWLSNHPMIASSFQAYQRGEFPDAQFYVVDEEVENKLAYSKKKEINKALGLLDSLSLNKRKQVARLLGLPVSDESSEEEVYRLIDDVLKQTEFRSGEHRGGSPTRVFTEFAEMDNSILETKDLVRQLITHNVVRREKGGSSLFRGESKLSDNEKTLVEFLLNDDNQQDRISLEQQLKNKKLASV